jgi:hypothetical protein
MRVLVACEFSGTVSDAFRARGHSVLSCDLLHSESEGEHYRGDVFDLDFSKFNLLLAFPPCTHLCSSGARWFKDKQQEQSDAIAFVKRLMTVSVSKIAIENPIGILSSAIRKPDQIIQPWQYGHPETKSTCLWLKGLPALQPSIVVPGRTNRVHRMSPGPYRSRHRSRTFPGIAQAMAIQWG